MIEETLKATGQVAIVLMDGDGNVKERRQIENLVVNVGKNYIASRMANASKAVMSHMAIGTGAAAPALGNTQLGSEIARASLAVSGGSVTDNTVTYSATFAAGVGTGAITEAGLFNASGANAGDMLARVSFPVINKGANDQIAITWTVTIN